MKSLESLSTFPIIGLCICCFLATNISLQATLKICPETQTISPCQEDVASGLPLYYWRQQKFVNFGDYISLKLVERIVNTKVSVYSKKPNYPTQKFVAIGSIISFCENGDIVWGSGINGKLLKKSSYPFQRLDIRAIRGPLSRAFLMNELGIYCPEVYGDPALLFPYLFPEFKKQENPSLDFVVIPHYSEIVHLNKNESQNIVYPTDPWDEVIQKILDSKLVISSSLHGLIIAEAYGIPAVWLRITENEPIFKYLDYYMGTGRFQPTYATSVQEALKIGGEKPFICDLEKLYNAFPFEFWPKAQPKTIKFGTDKNDTATSQ